MVTVPPFTFTLVKKSLCMCPEHICTCQKVAVSQTGMRGCTKVCPTMFEPLSWLRSRDSVEIHCSNGVRFCCPALSAGKLLSSILNVHRAIPSTVTCHGLQPVIKQIKNLESKISDPPCFRYECKRAFWEPKPQIQRQTGFPAAMPDAIRMCSLPLSVAVVVSTLDPRAFVIHRSPMHRHHRQKGTTKA